MTDDRPACLLPARGRPLLEWQIQALLRCHIRDIVLVRGWARARVKGSQLRMIDNPLWDRSGALESLRCALNEIRGEVMILPTDRFHGSPALQRARENRSAMSAMVDPEDHVLKSADPSGYRRAPETLLVDSDGLLGTESANRGPLTPMRFTGLIRLDPCGSETVRSLLRDSTAERDVASDALVQRRSLIDLVPMLLDRGQRVFATSIHGGWAGIDAPADLAEAERQLHEDPVAGIVLGSRS